MLRQVNHVLGADGAHVGHHGNPSVRRFQHMLQHLLALVQRQQKALAGRTAAVETLNAVGNLRIHNLFQRMVVDAFIGVGRGNQGGPNPFKILRFGCYHAVQPPSTTMLDPVMKEDA